MAAPPPLLAVVDDDADVRLALTRLAISAGFAVEAFASGADFLERIESGDRVASSSTCMCRG